MSTAIRQGIYQKLTGTSAVTSKLSSSTAVFHEQAPSDAAYPLIIFQKSSGTRTRAFTADAFQNETWIVKAIDRNTTSDRVEALAEVIETALNNGTITVSGKKLADLHLVGDIDYIEQDGDQQYRHAGATYRVVTTQP